MSSTDSLRPLFQPDSVAIVGATDDVTRASGRLVASMSSQGFSGRLYLVNPRRHTVQGRPCVASIADLPEQIDLVLIALPAPAVAQTLREAGQLGAKVAVVFASGFTDGEEGAQLQGSLIAAWREAGLRLLGPNTDGLRTTTTGLFAEQGSTLSSDPYRIGSVAFISQSGGLGGYFGSTYLRRLGAGTKYSIDTGNELDIDAADCLAYFAEDPEISSIGMLLEGCRDGRKLVMAVRRATSNGKAVIFQKIGRHSVAAAAAQSHTSALASHTELLESEVASAGAIVTRDERQLADALLLHDTHCVPSGPRLGIVTPSGGFGVLALDAATDVGLEVPPIRIADQIEAPAGLPRDLVRNPLDMSGAFRPGTDLLESCLNVMGAQASIDAVVLWHPHRLLVTSDQVAHLNTLSRSRILTGKPHFHCGMVEPEFRSALQEAGILSFDTPTRLIRALAAVTTPATQSASRVRTGSRAELKPRQPATIGSSALVGLPARDLLAQWGIKFCPTVRVASGDEALRLQKKWDAPLILKLETERTSHKTEAGLVVGPVTGTALERAFAELAVKAADSGDPQASIVVQPFVQGIELAIGAYHDPAFGPCVMVAHGGIFIEVIGDAAFAAAPIDSRKARQMLSELRLYPALAGSRGRQADIDAVVDALVGLSRFISAPENRDISCDVNPLIVRELGHGALAIDVRVVGGPRETSGGRESPTQLRPPQPGIDR